MSTLRHTSVKDRELGGVQTALACSNLSGAIWWQGGKRKETFQLCLWNLNICIEKVDG